ncbi:MAG TPA: murein L,D-transpeptidase catalytic domain family protein [Gillisia sp.]|nr:murein L,D-transpeptidase catalytic domain family protein [Gillisia sp.]
MTQKTLTVLAIIIFSFAFTTANVNNNKTITTIPESLPEISTELSIEEEIDQLYNIFSLNNVTVPNQESFKNGMMGYYKLLDQGLVKNEILTIIDFSLSSTKKRMWVLDMSNHKVLINSVVSHGKNTGNEFATKFSNTVNSLQSSLGFYVTAETYMGGNGYSLFIDGMEEKYNSKARERYVVIHGAEYANEDVAKRTGRLGRSYGCPAVPTALTNEFIDTIKGQSVLYIHSADEDYLQNSEMIKA